MTVSPLCWEPVQTPVHREIGQEKLMEGGWWKEESEKMKWMLWDLGRTSRGSCVLLLVMARGMNPPNSRWSSSNFISCPYLAAQRWLNSDLSAHRELNTPSSPAVSHLSLSELVSKITQKCASVIKRSILLNISLNSLVNAHRFSGGGGRMWFSGRTYVLLNHEFDLQHHKKKQKQKQCELVS